MQDGITVDMQSTKQTNGRTDGLANVNKHWTNLIQCHEQGTTPQPFVERDLSRVEFSRTIFFTLCQMVWISVALDDYRISSCSRFLFITGLCAGKDGTHGWVTCILSK